MKLYNMLVDGKHAVQIYNWVQCFSFMSVFSDNLNFVLILGELPGWGKIDIEIYLACKPLMSSLVFHSPPNWKMEHANHKSIKLHKILM